MDCPEFLARYSDFRDGLVTSPREVRRFERHLGRCPRCRRYDAAVRRGVVALQAAETVEPSPGFRRRLEERLRREQLRAAAPVLPARAGVAAALFLAVALTLVALETVAAGRRVALAPELPPVPFPKPVAQAGLPLVSFQDPRASVLGGNPSPYGTALAQPASIAIEPVTAGR
ncbi:MAG TPA: zf-HC2 domain-containing protein [Gemmatimonadales bacterium]|nr:zf-HC2 domain-containing protein [Gemmatimonadales bacterium]